MDLLVKYLCHPTVKLQDEPRFKLRINGEKYEDL